jgi:hypothetical protein
MRQHQSQSAQHSYAAPLTHLAMAQRQQLRSQTPAAALATPTWTKLLALGFGQQPFHGLKPTQQSSSGLGICQQPNLGTAWLSAYEKRLQELQDSAAAAAAASMLGDAAPGCSQQPFSFLAHLMAQQKMLHEQQQQQALLQMHVQQQQALLQ